MGNNENQIRPCKFIMIFTVKMIIGRPSFKKNQNEKCFQNCRVSGKKHNVLIGNGGGPRCNKCQPFSFLYFFEGFSCIEQIIKCIFNDLYGTLTI